MEPYMSLEGYELIQDSQKTRDLMTRFYKSLGYDVIEPKTFNPEKDKKVTDKAEKSSSSKEQ